MYVGYMRDCGGNIVFPPTASRAAITFCNRACEQARSFAGVFELRDQLQTKYMPWFNGEFILADGAYAYDQPASELRKRYGSPVYSVHAAEGFLEIKTVLADPTHNKYRRTKQIGRAHV